MGISHMCANHCGRRAYLKLHIRHRSVLICDTCSGELYRAGLIKTLGTALVVPATPNRMTPVVKMIHTVS